MSRVLVLANEHVNQKMAGPSIRCYELSRQLSSAGHHVTLASPFPTDMHDPAVQIVSFDDASLRQLAADTDVIVLQGWTMEKHPWLRDLPARIVIDLYDPFALEVLILFEEAEASKQIDAYQGALRGIHDQIRRGDFFMCASEKQLDYWAGWLSAANRINPHTYRSDPSLRTLIDVIPFGIPSDPPIAAAKAIRGHIDGIGEKDFVMLWAGGIYNWFDPVTLIRATHKAAQTQPNLRLVFMSTSHPNPEIQEMHTLSQARAISAELNLTGKHVFFNESWIDYQKRAEWLLDADLGVSTHFDHIETRYSFRTRVLDYFWAGLPVLCTAGDTIADQISEHNLGLTVPPGDVAAAAAAINKLAADMTFRKQCATNVQAFAGGLTWAKAAQPLERYCLNPLPAADRSVTTNEVALMADFPPRKLDAQSARRLGIRSTIRSLLRFIYHLLPEQVRGSKFVVAIKLGILGILSGRRRRVTKAND